MKKKNIIVIATAVYGRLSYLERMMASFMEHTNFRYDTPIFHIIIENSFDTEVREWLSRYQQLFDIVLFSPCNLGVAPAINLGWSQLYNSHKVKFDPDLEFGESGGDWITKFVKAMDDCEDGGLFGVQTSPIESSINAVMDNKYGIPIGNTTIDGAAMFVPEYIFKHVGYLCEDYGLYGFEDRDYNFRVRNLDKQLYYIRDLDIKHADEDSNYAYPYDKVEYLAKNRQKFDENLKLYNNKERLYQEDRLNFSEPKVAIVMPVYNQAQFAEDAISDILNQSHNTLVLVIVNDGSVDGLKQVVDKFEDRRLYYLEKAHGGTGSALNYGFKYIETYMSNVKYATWVSSDNRYNVDMIKTLVTFLEENNKHTFVYAPFVERIEPSGRTVIPEQYVPWTKEAMKKGCQMGICFLFHWFIKKTVGDYIEDLCEDFNMHIRMAMYGDFYFLNDSKPLGIWRNHANATTNIKKHEAHTAKEECLKLAREVL